LKFGIDRSGSSSVQGPAVSPRRATSRALPLVVAALGAAAGCGVDPTPAGAGTGGSVGGGGTGGGTGGMAGGGPAAPPSVPTCVRPPVTSERMVTASPLISVGKRVTASAGVVNAMRVADGMYPHDGAQLPAAMLPAWVAIEVGPGPAKLLLAWVDTGWGQYNTTTGGRNGGTPTGYRIEVSGDSTSGEDGTWEKVIPATGDASATVTNTVRERAHTFPFAGKTWVRMVVTAAGTAAGAEIDEISLHDATASGAGQPTDTWLFMGDSITAGGFRRDVGATFGFDGVIRQARPAYWPLFLNAGIGGELSPQGLGHIDEWLFLNPDIRYVALLYGTNDSWGDHLPASTSFEASMRGIVDKVLAAGRIPVLARIPYATVAHRTLPDFQRIIDNLSNEKGLPCGPDLYTWFRDHPEELNSDGVHPNSRGNRSINRLWAESVLDLYP
jgi:lysophospholipase L1-like esterase